MSAIVEAPALDIIKSALFIRLGRFSKKGTILVLLGTIKLLFKSA